MFRKLLPFIGTLFFAISVSACTGAPVSNTVGSPSQGAKASEATNGAAATAIATSAASSAANTTASGAPTTAPSQTAANAQNSIATASAASGLSPEEVTDLLHMREEEKLARDVYLTLYDKWGAQVFQNIAKAEQTHTDAVAALLRTYGIEDPVAKTSDARGVFTDPALQSLYNQLVSQGSGSLVDALKVGATIEDLDIKDLNEAIARTTHSDIRQVYENLKMGSENHMRAFVRNLRAEGADYKPKYISESEFQQILESAPGQGHGGLGGRGGHGCGRGQGRGG